MVDCCPTCGHPLASDLEALHLSNMQRRIFEIVQRAGTRGIDSDALFDRLYSGIKDGGPLTGKKSMYVIVLCLNRRLAKIGLRVEAPGTGRGTNGHYRLISTAQDYGVTKATILKIKRGETFKEI